MGSGCESNWRKIIGKPYAGKLHVRFDEGELEIGPSATTPVLYSTVMNPAKESLSIQHLRKDACLSGFFGMLCLFHPEGSTPFFSTTPTMPHK
jgi:hypothetical protein